MDVLNILLNICLIIGLICIGWIYKHSVPTYFEEKGKNLATKQDIEDITRKTEEVQKEFKESFERFSTDVKFKYEFYYRQYAELYCELYSFVIRSEYIRHSLDFATETFVDFEKAPFLQMRLTISDFNADEIVYTIIKKGDLASQKLIKLAVSYRYLKNIKMHITDKNKVESIEAEENHMVKEMVLEIVMNYNRLRKELNLSYDKDELESGKLSL